MPHAWVLQHAAVEAPGIIQEALTARGIAARAIRTFAGEPVPAEMGDAVALVVMGGPMGVYEAERFPFLRHEMRLIEDALGRRKPIVGVCLGSQLLAAALGAPVTEGNQKEIGWHPVHLSQAGLADGLFQGAGASFMAFHWHGDVFALPAGATSLARSALTEHQAFRYGESAYGILFHMEVTPPILRGMVEAFREELAEAGRDGTAIQAGAREHLPALQALGRTVFGRWAALIP